MEHVHKDCQCEGKRCSKCDEVKCYGSFNKEKRTKIGFTAACRACIQAAHRAYYRVNIEEYKTYRETHVIQVNAAKNAWAKNNPEKVRSAKNAWKKRNHERVRIAENKRRKAKYAANPDPAIERSRAYKRAHPEYNKMYAQANPEIIRTKTGNRRARRRHAIGTHTVQEWEALKSQYNYTCLRCGKKEPEIKLTPDHIVPLAKQGRNSIDNLQPLCLPCNTWKRTKIIDYRAKSCKE